MSDEEKRIKIAEACGWHPSKIVPGWWAHQSHLTAEKLPDYFGSLDAMHEAEKILTRGQHCKYSETLMDVVNRSLPEDDFSVFHPLHATASQRAEAFLRTLSPMALTL